MPALRRPARDYLGPEELSFLQRLLLQFCAEAGIEPDQERAENIAASLIEFYQFSTHDERRLRAKLVKQFGRELHRSRYVHPTVRP
jgi:hypothetical protein